MAGVQLGRGVTWLLMRQKKQLKPVSQASQVGPLQASLMLMSPDGRGRPVPYEPLDWLTQGEISELAAHFMRIKLWRL